VVLTVGGQFVSKNEAGQYYLDLDKAIDYDAQVDKKVSSLDPVPTSTIATTSTSSLAFSTRRPPPMCREC